MTAERITPLFQLPSTTGEVVNIPTAGIPSVPTPAPDFVPMQDDAHQGARDLGTRPAD